MKTVLLLSLLLGFAATLAAAHFARASSTRACRRRRRSWRTAAASESFLIRLPADRLAATDGEAGGMRALHAGGAMLLPAKLMAEPLLVEHFKVRDAAGGVVGIAARHWTNDANGPTTVWSVLIPSRGAVVLRAIGERRGAVDAALRANGYTAGKTWDGEVRVTMTDEPGVVATGSGEAAHRLKGTQT